MEERFFLRAKTQRQQQTKRFNNKTPRERFHQRSCSYLATIQKKSGLERQETFSNKQSIRKLRISPRSCSLFVHISKELVKTSRTRTILQCLASAKIIQDSARRELCFHSLSVPPIPRLVSNLAFLLFSHYNESKLCDLTQDVSTLSSGTKRVRRSCQDLMTKL